MQNFGSKDMTATLDPCAGTNEATYNMTLTSVPEVNGDHVCVLHFDKAFVRYVSISVKVITGSTVSWVPLSEHPGFLFTSDGESYELRLVVSNALAERAQEEQNGDVLSSIVSEIPYTVVAMYAPAWADGEGKIIIVPEVGTPCAGGIVLYPSECTEYGTTTKWVVLDVELPDLTTLRSVSLTYLLDGVETTTTSVTLSIDPTYKVFYLKSNVGDEFLEIAPSVGRLARFSIPVEAVPLTVQSVGSWPAYADHPGGVRIWDVSVARVIDDVIDRKFQETAPTINKTPSSYAATYLCNQIISYWVMNFQFGNCPAMVVVAEPVLENSSPEDNELSTSGFVQYFKYLEINSTYTKTLSAFGGTATATFTLVKPKCQTNIDVYGSVHNTVPTVEAVEGTVTPEVESWTEYFLLGTLPGTEVAVRVNMNVDITRSNRDGKSCTTGGKTYNQVVVSVRIHPYIRIGPL